MGTGQLGGGQSFLSALILDKKTLAPMVHTGCRSPQGLTDNLGGGAAPRGKNTTRLSALSTSKASCTAARPRRSQRGFSHVRSKEKKHLRRAKEKSMWPILRAHYISGGGADLGLNLLAEVSEEKSSQGTTANGETILHPVCQPDGRIQSDEELLCIRLKWNGNMSKNKTGLDA